MIRRSTVVYIIILLVLAGAYYYLKNRSESKADIAATSEPTEQLNYLFTADEGVPVDIRIRSKAGESVELGRDQQNLWALTLPVEAPAEQAAAEAAASQVTTMRVLDKVTGVDRKVVGLDSPDYTLTVKFNDGGERTVNIGVVTPSESGYYVQDSTGGDVIIVSKSSVDALLTLLTTPPYLETLTPGPIVTETPLPATPTVAPVTTETATPQS